MGVIITNLECKGDWQEPCPGHCWSCWLAPYSDQPEFASSSLLSPAAVCGLGFCISPLYLIQPGFSVEEEMMYFIREYKNMKWLFCSCNTTCPQFWTWDELQYFETGQEFLWLLKHILISFLSNLCNMVHYPVQKSSGSFMFGVLCCSAVYATSRFLCLS